MTKKMRILVVMLNKVEKNLGGQERRWNRISNKLKSSLYGHFEFVVNRHHFTLSEMSDARLPKDIIIYRDFSRPLIDYVYKNLVIMKAALPYNRVHFSSQSLYLIPAIFFIKVILRKVVSISYNGNTLTIHRDGSVLSYYNKVLFLHKLSDRLEVLNPRLLDENWIILSKTYIAPCSFSNDSLFVPARKLKKIAFAGHFYKEKGIELLRRIIDSSLGRGFEFKLFGDTIASDDSGNEFMEWLSHYSKTHDHVKFTRISNMSNAFSDVSVFLSLQQVSNYPSQSVIEALYSGCGVLMTDTGDSRMFGTLPFIEYVDSSEDVERIWNFISQLHEISAKNFVDISDYAKLNHSESTYVKFLTSFLEGDFVDSPVKATT